MAAALSLCQLGALIPYCVKMIHSMNHHICMAFGNSQQAAWPLATHNKAAGRQTWKTPIAGIGQRNGAGLPIWAAVSSPMFDRMHQEGFYALLMGTILCQHHKISGFAFIDNTDLCVTHKSNTVEKAIQHMQWSVNHWEGLL